MNIEVDTAVVVVAWRLPELWHMGACVIDIKAVLTNPADSKKSHPCRECSSIQRCKICRMVDVALVFQDFVQAVQGAAVGELSVGQRPHCLEADADRVEGLADSDAEDGDDSSGPESVDRGGAEPEVAVFLGQIERSCHGAHEESEFKAIGKRSAEESSLLRSLLQTIKEVAVVSFAAIRV